MEEPLAPLALFGYTYCCCAWCSFGLYAVSDKTWTVAEALAKTIHGANTGIIFALLGVRWIGFDKPWEVIGLAASASIGWTRKEAIFALVEKLLKK